MFSKFSEEAQKVLVMSKKEMQDLRHPYVGSEHLLLAILKQDNDIKRKLEECQVTYKKFREELVSIVGMGKEDNHWFLYTPLLKRVIENAILSSKESSENEVTVEHLFLSLIEEGDGVAIRILSTMAVDLEEIYELFSTKIVNKKSKSKKKLFVEEFGVDLTKKALQKEIDPVIGREDEINRVIEILSRRTKNNPLLVGEAGVGKTAVVEELARLIVEKQVPNSLANKRIFSVAMAGLVAGTKYRGEFEERINKILKEVESNPDIILFIDEIHTLMGAGGAEGAIDASNIFKPALSRGKLQLIGATTVEEYKQTIEKDKAFDRRFQTVFIMEPTKEKTYQILLELKSLYEGFHGVLISDDNLKRIIELTDKYMYQRKQPDKSIDILDEVCAKVSLCETKESEKLRNYQKTLLEIVHEKNLAISNQDFEKASTLKNQEKLYTDKKNRLELKTILHKKAKEVQKEDIAEIIELKTKIPVYEIDLTSRNKFLDLEKYLKSKVLGQDRTIEELCNVTKRIKFGFKESQKPSSFLFVGSTGIGKTLLVKEYASYLFGKENFIRLDMSEYRESHSISKLIGSPPGYVGYEEQKHKFEDVRQKPHSVILLDEIEKAHPVVINLFLQILDEGKINDSRGNEIRFDNTIIIMTSNVGYGKESVGFSKSESTVMTKLKDSFSIEFINRIGHIELFSRITKDVIEKIVIMKLQQIKAKFLQRGISLQLDKKIVGDIVTLSNYEEFGARQVEKVISQHIDKIVIDQMIEGKNQVKIKSLL